MNDDIIQFLSSVKPFSMLPEDDLNTIAQSSVLEDLPVDSILTVQGKSGFEFVHVVKSGLIELFYDKKGKRILSDP
ncbi:MAG: hypothetical protein HOE30_22820 [Deltaproteobacteria bacterium]|nr:hypothetical protein [Deltaproteobacteria bacterium]MBT4262572.1 hypothetical protein [Deltaproteobacteria bacterium]